MCEHMIVNGTHYPKNADDSLVRVLESARLSGRRIRLHYGDVATGTDWLDEYGVTGTIGRSTGPCKIPIMVASSRSMGGGDILVECIIRIRPTTGTRYELYRYPQYQQQVASIVPADLPEYSEMVVLDGYVHARFVKIGQAARWCRRMGLAIQVAP